MNYQYTVVCDLPQKNDLLLPWHKNSVSVRVRIRVKVRLG